MNSMFLSFPLLAQVNADPAKGWWDTLLGLGCVGTMVFLYLGMLYATLIKSKDWNYPKIAFAFGLLIASPLVGMVVGLVGAGLGWLVGSLFGNSAVGAGYGGAVGLWGTIIGSFFNWLVSFGRQD